MCALSFILGFVLGGSWILGVIHREAVLIGHAEYEIAEDGRPEWRWRMKGDGE